MPKKHVLTILKSSLAIGILYWLVNSGKVDFSKVNILFTNWVILTTFIFSRLAGTTLLSAYRWKVLLNALAIRLKFFDSVNLQLVGSFFNVAMPGSVGGDLIKAYYVGKEQPKHGYSKSLISIFMDRLIGLSTLMAIWFIFVMLNFGSFFEISAFKPVLLISLFVFGAMVLSILGIVFFSKKKFVFKLIRKLRKSKLSSIGKLIQALTKYRKKPNAISLSIVISALSHSIIMLYFWVLCSAGELSNISLMNFIAVYPIGMLLTALPLSPGGLGVGHIAFEKLFLIFGSYGGANAFNVFIFTNLMVNLLGFIPYILRKKSLNTKAPQVTNA